ncbi:MAG: glycosyltransferase [Desulfobacterium sp.]|nr:glycosyltransferase [Desulfobacteraceae bacterium]MBA3037163.1 glycosyltransferase [Desulfobacterium sp.]
MSQISIITPVLNGIRFIEFCVKNVISQQCPDCEHIILDGGSTDGTVDLVRSYAEKYSHISWLSEKDRGQADAMNKGIAMTNSSILGVLNADDFYQPDILDRIVARFKTLKEPALLVGNCNVWDDHEKIVEINKPSKLKIVDLMMGWTINPYPTNPSQYFYHKSLHDKIGMYDSEEHYSLDIDFLTRAVQQANVTYVDEVWGNYRKIRGTKTMMDLESGQCVPRFKAVLEKYRKQLSLPSRVEIAFKRTYHKLF